VFELIIFVFIIVRFSAPPCRTQRFSIVFATAGLWYLPWTRWIQSTASNPNLL